MNAYKKSIYIYREKEKNNSVILSLFTQNFFEVTMILLNSLLYYIDFLINYIVQNSTLIDEILLLKYKNSNII